MKVSELIKALADFNPNAEVDIKISEDRVPLTGIHSWSAYTGEAAGPRNLSKEKLLTKQVTLIAPNSVNEESKEEYKTIGDKVKSILVEHLDLSIPYGTTLNSSNRLREDFNMDTYDFVEVIMKLEREFTISIPDEDTYESKTVGDLIKQVIKHLK